MVRISTDDQFFCAIFTSQWSILNEIVHLAFKYNRRRYWLKKSNSQIIKHFPADTTIYKGKATFLTDKKIDAELYAFLMQHSYGTVKGCDETRVYKSDLPTQVDICSKLGIKSRNTLRSHMNYLIESGYIIDNGDYYIIDTKKENIFLKIDLDTIQFLNDTVKAPVWKTYIYLGQRWNWKKSGFVFDLKDLAEHIGKKMSNNDSTYRELNNILQCLENNGLIKVANFYDGKGPKKRLIEFNYHHKQTM